MAAVWRLCIFIEERAPVAVAALAAHHLVRYHGLRPFFFSNSKPRHYPDCDAHLCSEPFDLFLFFRQQEHTYLAKFF